MKKMTEKSLQEAFAGESMAHMKYLLFSDVAEKEGYPNIARLFKATAYAEQVHAHNHARLLGYAKKTVENLGAGFEGETFEVDEMYPAYDAIAKAQGEKGAEKSIHFAVEAEKIHAKYYTQAKEGAEKNKDMNIGDIYICPVCGFTEIGQAPDKCPVCGVAKDKFNKF
jgi:rubrerythrin